MDGEQTTGYGYIARTFLKIGATAFGGWSSTALLVDKELVASGRINKAQLHGAIAYAQIIPGATQVQIVSNVGYRLKGARGAFLAALCFITPALILFFLFSILYFHYLAGTKVMNHIGGIAAALGGILFANAYRVSKMHVTHQLLWGLVALAAAMRLLLGITIIAIVLLFGLCGLGLSYLLAYRKQQ
ncbi:MAG TPA: chromate transporter [Candidatus Saccharimonadales bacterium]|nr:chromate transporter [Candidatus Saccharimonadales bacterium]